MSSSFESPTTAKREFAPRLGGVDGLRGLAALIVLIFHAYGQSGGPELRVLHVNVLRPLTDGWAAVNLFLVLSGFCLYWPFAHRPGKADRVLRPLDYLKRRSVRILPTFYASLLFCGVVGLAVPSFTAEPFCLPGTRGNLLSHLLLLNAWFPKHITAWNSVTWSLSLEWTWYAVFPLTLLLFRRIGATRGFLVLSLICLVYRVGLRLALGPIDAYHPENVNYSLVLRSFVVGRLFEFGLGMFVAAWAAGGRVVSAWVVKTELAGVFVLLGLGHLTTPVDGFLPVRDGIYGLASALLLMLVVVPQGNPARRVLNHSWMVWVGEFSYTLYLFHLVLLGLVAIGLRKLGFAGLPLFSLMLASLPGIVLACWMIYLIVERPFVIRRPEPPVPSSDAIRLGVPAIAVSSQAARP